MASPFDTFDYLEQVRSESPISAGVSLDGWQLTQPYDTSAEDLTEKIADILGNSAPDGVGGLERTLPKSHPQFPWLVASRLEKIQGLGHREADGSATGELVDAEEELEVPPLVPSYWLFPRYRFWITYNRPRYAILSDEQIETRSITWYDENGDEVVEDIQTEWWRFCFITKQPDPEFAFAQLGQMVYERGDGVSVGVPLPHEKTFHGHPRVPLPRSQLRVNWLGIPYRYVLSENSYFDQYIGWINQLDWNGRPPGSLLFMGVQVDRIYAPPVPERDPWFDTTVFSVEMLCDVTILLWETRRESPSVPDYATTNRNWLAAHWNLEPFLSEPSNFYYVRSVSGDPDTDFDKRQPKFLSFPIQLLFQDPDV